MEKLEQIFENEVLKNLKEGKISGKSIKELPVLFERRGKEMINTPTLSYHIL